MKLRLETAAMDALTVRLFDAAGIEAAFSNAPDSFIRIDPGNTGASIESLGVGDFFTDIAVFARLDGFEFLYGRERALIDSHPLRREIGKHAGASRLL